MVRRFRGKSAPEVDISIFILVEARSLMEKYEVSGFWNLLLLLNLVIDPAIMY